jgi:hypothetical protein
MSGCILGEVPTFSIRDFMVEVLAVSATATVSIVIVGFISISLVAHWLICCNDLF